MQSQWESFIETILNTASGFAISWLMTTWVLPLYGFPVSPRVRIVVASS
jgi:hypothetical protein